MQTIVINKKNVKSSNSNDVYIGRPSKWGNPFVIGKDGDRNVVVEKYKNWILAQPQLLNDLQTLEGKRLICFCKPFKCHGDVLINLINKKNKHNEATIQQYFDEVTNRSGEGYVVPVSPPFIP